MNKNKYALATITLRVFDPKRSDKTATTAAIEQTRADTTSGRFVKNIVRPEMLKPINTLMNEVRSYHYNVTVPWGATGLRKLHVDMLDDYFARMRQHRDKLNVLVDAFCKDYAANREEEKVRLAGMFNPMDYPPVENVRNSFEIYVDIPSIPSDVVVSPEIAKELEEQGKRLEQEAHAEVTKRVSTVLQAMVKKLSDQKAIFRDSLVGNVKDLVDVLPSLNVLGDATIDDVCKEMKEKLATLDPDELRDNPVARMDAAETAKATLAKLGNLFDLDAPAET